jgi:hypothetical protein
MEDCCGFCPKPQTDKEKEVAEEESKIYISGKITFLTDDPGRQVRILSHSIISLSFTDPP